MPVKMLNIHIYFGVLALFLLTGCGGGFYIDPPLSCSLSIASTLYRPVTLGASSDPEFAWSPNGQHIAYRNSQGEVFVLLNVIEEKERAQRRFIGTGRGLSWSTDGSRITYVTRAENTNAVMVVDIGSGESIKIVEEENPLFPPVWSTANEAFVFTDRTESRSMTLVLANTGSYLQDDWRVLTESEFGEDIYVYSWSPDGNYILFEKIAAGEDTNLYTYNLSSNAERLVTESSGCEEEGVWSPDGGSVAFSSNHNGNWDIFVASVEAEGKLNNLTNSQVPQDFYPTWSAVKNQIVFVSYHSYSDSDFSQDLFLIDPDGKNLLRLTSSPEIETYPVWSPSDPYLAYLSFNEAQWHINIAAVENNRLLPIHSFPVD